MAKRPEDYPGCLDTLLTLFFLAIFSYFATFGWKYVEQVFYWIIK